MTSTRLLRLVAAVAALGLVACAQVPPATPTGPSTAPDPTASSTRPTASGTPSPSPTPTPAEPPRLSITISGDLLWHSGLWETAAQVARRTGHTPYDFSELFAHVRPIIRGADLAICHEEVPMAPDGTDPSGYPVFGAPQEVAPAIALPSRSQV